MNLATTAPLCCLAAALVMCFVAPVDARPKKSPAGPAKLCAPPTKLPAVRRVDLLEVRSPPEEGIAIRGVRERSHTQIMPFSRRQKPPRLPAPRRWVGSEVPDFVPLKFGATYLDLLDPVDGGYAALYREPKKHCRASHEPGRRAPRWNNCIHILRVYDCDGTLRSSTTLNRFFSRGDHLAIHDIHYENGIVYFNEACQTYRGLAKGPCSALIAVELAGAAKVVFRTDELVSNGRILAHGDNLVTGYGYGRDRKTLRLVRKSDGRELRRIALSEKPIFARGSHLRLRLLSPHYLEVRPSGSSERLYFYLGDDKAAELIYLGKKDGRRRTPPRPRLDPPSPRPRGPAPTPAAVVPDLLPIPW